MQEPQQEVVGTCEGVLARVPPAVAGGEYTSVTVSESDGAGVTLAPSSGDRVCSCTADHSEFAYFLCICEAQQPAGRLPISRDGCAPDPRCASRLSHGCICTECSCACACRGANGANAEVNISGTPLLSPLSGSPERRLQSKDPTLVQDGQTGLPIPADKPRLGGRSRERECLPEFQSNSCGFSVPQDRQMAPSQNSDSQSQAHWLTLPPSLPVEEGSIVSNSSDSGHPEGWEHVRCDDTDATHKQSDDTMQTEGEFESKPLRGNATPGHQEAGTDTLSGWSSPSAEFELIADAPWCDVRQLLRVSSGQNAVGMDLACSGLTSALMGEKSNSSNAAEALATMGDEAEEGEGATVAADSGRTDRQGCPVVKLLRSAVYSSILSGSDFIRRQGTVGKAPLGTRATPAPDSSSAILSGWGGRWQLTPVDPPLDNFSSSDRRSGSDQLHPAFSYTDEEVPRGLQGDHRQLQAQVQNVISSDSDTVRPRSPMGSRSLAANSGMQQRTVPTDEANAAIYFDSSSVASKVEAAPSSAKDSYTGGIGRRRASATGLHDLNVHRVSLAQQHLEGQSRRVTKRGLRLNILITSLPGVDTGLFCRHMFAEWQEVSRQRVSCGEEFVFRSPCLVPTVEVPVIATTSFASALPYCELRLLEEWGQDMVLQQEVAERRVHVCLFLIPHSALPLSTGVLALLRRLRAVACMLPVLIVQQSASSEQILRDRGKLRLQLAASDLATLEEMLLPLHPKPWGPEACAHCQKRMHEKDQLSQVHSEPWSFLLTRGLFNGDTVNSENPSDATNQDTPEAQRPRDDNEEGINNSVSGCIRKACSQRQPTEGEGEGGLRPDTLEEASAPANGLRCKMQGSSGIPRGLNAVHLPLVLQLPLSDTSGGKDSRCACTERTSGSSEEVTTPLSLRGMLVEASAGLLHRRAEYGCFLPFLFQQQMQPNRTQKLRGLQQWEHQEKQQREQQEHVEALVDLRQWQIDRHPNIDTAMQMQRQLDGQREQLRKMQQQLLHLQEKRFLQELLTEEAELVPPHPSPQRSVFLRNSGTDSGEREELLSQLAQTGVVLALMLGVGTILFSSMKRGNF
ncbi:hypothetical protein, conserved [Eimeria maxima]|uniref:Uncharacterized protein n=1 Tax=Eimeria maxima TaxID=5804 RepID=U6MAL4_EIMMA|nr:hypothetical protein, conserved [Eimeria maxima]CDJ61056.1 hypothetical protein, conserved [Eimeria maxima]